MSLLHKLGVSQCRRGCAVKCVRVDSVAVGVTGRKGHTSCLDPDATVELYKATASDKDDGDDNDDDGVDGHVSSSHLHSAAHVGKSFVSGQSCEDMDNGNFVQLDAEISVKLVTKHTGDRKSLLSGSSFCGDIGSTVLNAAVASDYLVVNAEENTMLTECMEYDALKHKCSPISTVCNTDGASSSTADINSNDDVDEVILLEVDDCAIMSAEYTEMSAHVSSGSGIRDVDHSCDKYTETSAHVSSGSDQSDSHCEAAETDETPTYIQMSTYNVLSKTEADAVSEGVENDENDGFIVNKRAGRMNTVLSDVTNTYIHAVSSDLLTKTGNDAIYTNDAVARHDVNCETERLVVEKHDRAIIATAEMTTFVDVCNTINEELTEGDVVSTCAVNYECDRLFAETHTSGLEMEAAETIVFMQNPDNLINNSLCVSAVDCANDRMEVEKSRSVVQYLCSISQPAETALLCNSNADVDEVTTLADGDVVNSTNRYSVTADRSSMLPKSTKQSREMMVSTNDS